MQDADSQQGRVGKVVRLSLSLNSNAWTAVAYVCVGYSSSLSLYYSDPATKQYLLHLNETAVQVRPGCSAAAYRLI